MGSWYDEVRRCRDGFEDIITACPATDYDRTSSVRISPDVRIPSSLPEFVVEDFLIEDIQRTGEDVQCHQKDWECYHPPHTTCM